MIDISEDKITSSPIYIPFEDKPSTEENKKKSLFNYVLKKIRNSHFLVILMFKCVWGICIIIDY